LKRVTSRANRLKFAANNEGAMTMRRVRQ
jgi:hypothetical protein